MAKAKLKSGALFQNKQNYQLIVLCLVKPLRSGHRGHIHDSLVFFSTYFLTNSVCFITKVAGRFARYMYLFRLMSVCPD